MNASLSNLVALYKSEGYRRESRVKRSQQQITDEGQPAKGEGVGINNQGTGMKSGDKNEFRKEQSGEAPKSNSIRCIRERGADYGSYISARDKEFIIFRTHGQQHQLTKTSKQH
jgi:hypothetical protein